MNTIRQQRSEKFDLGDSLPLPRQLELFLKVTYLPVALSNKTTLLHHGPPPHHTHVYVIVSSSRLTDLHAVLEGEDLLLLLLQ